VCERRAADVEQQRDQQHARRGAEVAAVDTDQEVAADSSRIVVACRRWLATLVARSRPRRTAIAIDAPPSRIGTIFSKPSE